MRPQSEVNGLRDAGLGPSDIEYQSILARIDIGYRSNPTAGLNQFAVVKIEYTLIIAGLGQSVERDSDPTRREATWQGVGAIELSR
jgi:hypothetical protein